MSRERLMGLLPGWMLDHEEVVSGFGTFVADCYRVPTNKAEAEAHSEMLERNWAVLRRGWPDFLVMAGPDDLFVVEVKAPGDEVRTSQRIVLETLARKGIDAYIRWGKGDGVHYEAIGDSKSWAERVT